MPSRAGFFLGWPPKKEPKKLGFPSFTALYLRSQESDQIGPLPNPVAEDGSGFEEPRLPFCQLLGFEAKG